MWCQGSIKWPKWSYRVVLLEKKISKIFFGLVLPKISTSRSVKTRDFAFWAHLEAIFQTSKTSHIAAKFDSKCPKYKLSITCDFQKKYHNFLRTLKKSQNFRAIWLPVLDITQSSKRGVVVHMFTPFSRIFWLFRRFLSRHVVSGIHKMAEMKLSSSSLRKKNFKNFLWVGTTKN